MSESSPVDPEAAVGPKTRAWATVRATLKLILLAVGLLAAFTGRVVWGGERAITRGTEALEAGDPRGAVEASREAASWYVPAAPHVRVAYARLAAIAAEAERLKDRELALFALRAITTASDSTRWLVTPYAEDAKKAREAIARLEASAPRPIDHVSEPVAQVEQRFLAELSKQQGPRRDLSALLGLSFSAMLLGAFLALRRGFDESGRIHLRAATLPAVLAALGLTGYVALLLLV